MDMPKGQSDVHSSSLRLPFSMIVGYVNWTIKSNQYNIQIEISLFPRL